MPNLPRHASKIYGYESSLSSHHTRHEIQDLQKLKKNMESSLNFLKETKNFKK